MSLHSVVGCCPQDNQESKCHSVSFFTCHRAAWALQWHGHGKCSQRQYSSAIFACSGMEIYRGIYQLNAVARFQNMHMAVQRMCTMYMMMGGGVSDGRQVA